MIPVLIKPLLHSIKNRWRIGSHSPNSISRDIIIFMLALSVMTVIYQGTFRMLTKITQDLPLIYLPPSRILGLILMMLFLMVFTANIASAIGALFLGDDLDLVISSPSSIARIFYGKFAYTFLSSSWMPFVFIMPLILAFGQFYSAPLYYYWLSIIILIPFFIIPCALAVLISAVAMRFLPLNRTKEMIWTTFAGMAIAGIYLISVLKINWSSGDSAKEIIRIVAILSAPTLPWIPSNWAAACLQQMLNASEQGSFPNLLLLFSSSIALTMLAFLVVSVVYYDAYSRSRSFGNKDTKEIKRRKNWYAQILSLSPRERAIVAKEFKHFSRDITYTIQLIMLALLCVIYIFNLKVFLAIDSLPVQGRMWWRQFFFISNFSMNAFITTAICTRFVYSSISLEGRSFWVIETAPIKTYDFLEAKFTCWYFPVSIISCAVFSLGAYAAGAPGFAILVNAASAWLVCYGIVGVGIGLGALFANFHWEHPSQLAGSFGSLVFMLSSILLILFNAIPIWYLLFFRPAEFLGMPFTATNKVVLFTIGAIVMVMMNLGAKNWAMRNGGRALDMRLTG